MHYHVEVWLPNITDDLDEQIELTMYPFSENADVFYDEEEEYWYNPDAIFDWYRIGGRYTGRHDGYDPSKDLDNWENCPLCRGTGFRDDVIGKDARKKNPSYTCNGCGVFDAKIGKWSHGPNGEGFRLKWPTQWVRYSGDVIEVAKIKDDLTAYHLVVGDKVYSYHNWDYDTHKLKDGSMRGTIKQKLEELGITDGYLVTVDCHD